MKLLLDQGLPRSTVKLLIVAGIAAARPAAPNAVQGKKKVPRNLAQVNVGELAG
jgi:hypothetical protein